MKIMIVDDNADLLESLTLGFKLQWSDCQIIPVSTGKAAIALFRSEKPDVILLDIGLPDIYGFEVLKSIREESWIPILMLTVRNEELDKVKAFELGADDYVVKPFSSLELLARIKAVLRRAEVTIPPQTLVPFKLGELQIDYSARKVFMREQQINLTPIEYKLLCALARYPDQVISRQFLLARVWGSEYRGETDFVKVYIKHLRDKVEKDPANPEYIHTERGLGYRLSHKT